MPNHDLRVGTLCPGLRGHNRPRTDTIASQLEAIRQRIASDGLECDPELCFVDDGYTGISWSARASNDFGTKPPPVSSTASTSSIQIDFHANMHIRF